MLCCEIVVSKAMNTDNKYAIRTSAVQCKFLKKTKSNWLVDTRTMKECNQPADIIMLISLCLTITQPTKTINFFILITTFKIFCNNFIKATNVLN